jgi:hypothetical protein
MDSRRYNQITNQARKCVKQFYNSSVGAKTIADIIVPPLQTIYSIIKTIKGIGVFLRLLKEVIKDLF